MDPTFGVAHVWMGIGLEQKGLYEEAIASLDEGVKCLRGASVGAGAAAHARAVSGRIEEARQQLGALQQAPPGRYVDPYAIALIHAALDEPDQALECLEQAKRERSVFGGMWDQRRSTARRVAPRRTIRGSPAAHGAGRGERRLSFFLDRKLAVLLAEPKVNRQADNQPAEKANPRL